MIHIDGFEEFANDPAPNPQLQRAQYETFGNWAIVGGRLGAHGIAGRNAALVRKMEWKTGVCSVGFAHIFDTRGSACWLRIGEVQVNLWLHPDTGLPYLNDKPGGALPTANRWYYYELELDRASQVLTLAINNRIDMTFQVEGDISAEEIEVGIGYILPHIYRPGADPEPVDNANKTFDDFYMRDDKRFGPIVVSTRFPTTDEQVEWFKASPTGTHSESLGMRPPKPLDNYVAANVVGADDRFSSAHELVNANPVIATGVVVLARKAPTLNARLGVFIGGGMGDTAPPRNKDTEVDTEWKTQYLFFEGLEPDTPESIKSADFGIYVAAP